MSIEGRFSNTGLQEISTSTGESTPSPTLSQHSEETVKTRTEQAAATVLQEEKTSLSCLRRVQCVTAFGTGSLGLITGTLCLVFGFCLTPPLAAPAIKLAATSFGCFVSSIGACLWAARTEDTPPAPISMH